MFSMFSNMFPMLCASLVFPMFSNVFQWLLICFKCYARVWFSSWSSDQSPIDQSVFQYFPICFQCVWFSQCFPANHPINHQLTIQEQERHMSWQLWTRTVCKTSSNKSQGWLKQSKLVFLNIMLFKLKFKLHLLAKINCLCKTRLRIVFTSQGLICVQGSNLSNFPYHYPINRQLTKAVRCFRNKICETPGW